MVYVSKFICLVILISQIHTLKNELEQNKIYLTVGSKTLTATLDSINGENKAVTYLKNLLPVKYQMYDYASLAKGYTFHSSFKKMKFEMEKNDDIKIGDIVLYDYKHLMIFYHKFKSDEKYIKIGKLDSIDELNDFLGEKEINVVWSLCDPTKNDCSITFNSYYSRFIHYLTWKVFGFVCFLLL